MTNLVLALEHLLESPVLYNDGSSYERLTATWFDPRPVPTEAELEAAWIAYQAEKEQAAQEQAQMEQRTVEAKDNAAAIPAWAAWTEAEAVTYIQTNVTDLASARTVLIALTRMVVALRDSEWPDLHPGS